MRRRYTLLALSIIFGILLPVSAQQPTRPSTADEVIATMHAIRAAVANGDKDTWETMVAPNCSFIEPNGRPESRAFHSPVSRTATANDNSVAVTSSFGSLNVHEYGDTAVLTYREDLETRVGERQTTSAIRYSEVYQRVGGKWLLIFSAETPIPLPTVIQLDPKIYDDYVGEYQLTPQLSGRIYREGDRLWLSATGWKRPYELLPVKVDTFIVKGMEENEITFVRNQEGKVVEQNSKFRGQQQGTAKKVK